MKFTFQPESKPLDGYTIKRAIDRGGFGEVYYALSDSGKEVALKLLLRNMDIELRGIRQCMNLKHTNLMTIFDIKTDGDGDHWVIMEYVSGQTLEQVLDGHPQGMPMEEVLRWLDGVASGAAYLHDRGVVHRDLKPANIFLDAGVVKIGDIGLSKYITPSRRSGHTESVGTVHYMAPEVAHGRYGNELDVYSTAIMVYEMITGSVPFDGESTGEIIMKHLTEKPDLSKLPERLRPVLGKALEKDPNQRTHSIARFARDVRTAIQGNNGAVQTAPEPTEIPEDSFVQAATPKVESPQPQRAQTAPRNKAAAVPTQPESVGGLSKQNLIWALIAIVFVVAAMGPGPVVRASFLVAILGAIGYFVYWLFFVPFNSQLSEGSREKLRDSVDDQKNHPEKPKPTATRDEEKHVQSLPASELPQEPPKVRPTKRWRYGQTSHSAALTPLTIRPVTFRERITAAAQSMTLAVVFAVPVLAVVAFLLPQLQTAGRLGLFGVTTIVASWLVLLPAKLWEGSAMEPSLRRLILGAVGVVVGLLAFGVDQTLMVDVPLLSGNFRPNEAMMQSIGNQPLLEENAKQLQLLKSGLSRPGFNYDKVRYQPTLAGYVVFFAGLLGLRRWWWHVDSFRPKRFRVSSLVLTGILAWLLTCVAAFPHGWGALWAVAISAVVQLAATWTPPHVRPKLMEGN